MTKPESPENPDNSEYEDEPPGAYLTQLHLGWGAAAWGGSLILLTGLLAGLSIWLRDRPVGPPGDPLGPLAPLELSWRFLPLLAGIGFLVSLFMRLNSVPRSKREAVLGAVAVWLQLLSLLLWMLLRWGFHLGFLPEQ